MFVIRELTPVEARVLAVLVEKQHTVPDSYPLSLNALTLGCNQKTAREPVMNLSEAEVLAALNALKDLSLVFEVSGSRVTRFEHNLKRVYGIPGQSEALLTTLVLRGPQTVAELRLNCERLHRFADLSSVEGFLDELTTREPPLARLLPKAPCAREPRWVSLLCGAPDPASLISAPVQSGRSELAEEVAALRVELDALKAEVAQLRQALGEGA
ncbi:YceH family protein [Inhella inkyongensis]|uniref:YceH family protein n=1 Tax=Inhella inkyongensis TaxID=392593 RepID=UPI00110D6A75|nr:YceH family protein [Inhella inkyongensis]